MGSCWADCEELLKNEMIRAAVVLGLQLVCSSGEGKQLSLMAFNCFQCLELPAADGVPVQLLQQVL